MKRNFKIFIDMDGTIVDFGNAKENIHLLYKMYEKDFFIALKPLPFLYEVNKIASLFPENIFILSACIDSPYCKKEKIAWLKQHLPAVMKENVIFTSTKRKKTTYVSEKLYGGRRRKLSKYDILIDDYGKNILDWEKAGGTAIKFKNDYNLSTGTKYNYVIGDLSQLLDMIETIRVDLDEKKVRGRQK